MRQILEDIKSGDYKHVYLLCGEEAYLRNQYRSKLISALVGDDSMNYSRFEGKGIDPKEIMETGDTMPFFAERRVILVENSGFFKSKSEELSEYLGNLPDYLVIVFSEEEADKRNKLYKAVARYGYIALFEKQDEQIRTRWVLGRMKKEGKQITKADLELFLSMAGEDMSNIDHELTKLLCYTIDQNVIRKEDILAVCTGQITNRIFDMVRAVSAGEQEKAMALYRDLLFLKEPPLRILFLIARQFNQLQIIREMQSAGKDSGTIAKTAGVASFALKKYLPIARGYSALELEKAVGCCVQTEEDIKTGRISDILGLELLIVTLCSEKKR